SSAGCLRFRPPVQWNRHLAQRRRGDRGPAGEKPDLILDRELGAAGRDERARLRTYHLIIVPGGDFTRIGTGLRKDTAARLRDAVQDGVNYLGICAGAFFAGRSPYNGLNLTSGVQFGFYSAEVRGIRKAAVAISGAGTPTLDQYWEDGPQLSGWGAVVGRYPDGTPAVVQGQSGEGWIILTGIHPEAP